MTHRLTPAQQRALDWLPKDGSWRVGGGWNIPALYLVHLRYWGAVALCISILTGEFFVRLSWRLTPAGLALFRPEPESEKP